MSNTVGQIARDAIKAGKSNKEALAAIHAEIPTSKADLATINWYRNKMRKTDDSIKTAREIAEYRKEMNLPEEGDEVQALYDNGVLSKSKKRGRKANTASNVEPTDPPPPVASLFEEPADDNSDFLN